YIVIPAKTKNQNRKLKYRHSRKNKKIKNTKLKYRHSRAGGNLGLSVRKLIGKNGFSNPETPDSCFRRNPVF
ncbi:TPA: hypothetical protein ACJJ7H_001570, partial [Neisseria meningitidis]